MLERIKAMPHKRLGRIGIFLLVLTVGIQTLAAHSMFLTMLQGTFLIVGFYFTKTATEKRKAEKALQKEEERANHSISRKAKIRPQTKSR